MNNNTKPSTRNNSLLTQGIADEFLIYDMTVNKAYSLNQTSSVIWQLCDGTRTVNEVAEDTGKKLGSTVSEDFIWLAINQFKEDGLLEDNDIKSPHLSGLTRRQLIRKVGIASAVALPLITSLVVPKAAEAQSRTACLDDGTSCNPTFPARCCSNLCNYLVSAGGFRCGVR